MVQVVKIIYGVPFGSSISKEYRDVLDEFHVHNLDTGASYVYLSSITFIQYNINDAFSLEVRKQLGIPARPINSSSTRKQRVTGQERRTTMV